MLGQSRSRGRRKSRFTKGPGGPCRGSQFSMDARTFQIARAAGRIVWQIDPVFHWRGIYMYDWPFLAASTWHQLSREILFRIKVAFIDFVKSPNYSYQSNRKRSGTINCFLNRKLRSLKTAAKNGGSKFLKLPLVCCGGTRSSVFCRWNINRGRIQSRK